MNLSVAASGLSRSSTQGSPTSGDDSQVVPSLQRQRAQSFPHCIRSLSNDLLSCSISMIPLLTHADDNRNCAQEPNTPPSRKMAQKPIPNKTPRNATPNAKPDATPLGKQPAPKAKPDKNLDAKKPAADSTEIRIRPMGTLKWAILGVDGTEAEAAVPVGAGKDAFKFANVSCERKADEPTAFTFESEPCEIKPDEVDEEGILTSITSKILNMCRGAKPLPAGLGAQRKLLDVKLGKRTRRKSNTPSTRNRERPFRNDRERPSIRGRRWMTRQVYSI